MCGGREPAASCGAGRLRLREDWTGFPASCFGGRIPVLALRNRDLQRAPGRGLDALLRTMEVMDGVVDNLMIRFAVGAGGLDNRVYLTGAPNQLFVIGLSSTWRGETSEARPGSAG